MPSIVGGFDIHRKQLTSGYLDLVSGEVRRGQITPADRGHLRSWLARLDGRGTTHTDTLAQKVTVAPSNGTYSSASFSFWLYIRSNDPTSKAYDTLKVQVLNSSGKVLKTLATYSNRSTRGKYLKHSFSLNAYLGQTITLKFTGKETLLHHNTSFFVDDNALNAS